MQKAKLMDKLDNYLVKLRREEKSVHTILKYQRDVVKFLNFIWQSGDFEIKKEKIIDFKWWLETRYKTASVNSILTAVNGFMEFLGLASEKVRLLKVQREIFSTPEKELTKAEYERLLISAEQRENKQLSLVIQTICSSGIRVSELQFLTLEALQARRMIVNCKNKKRTVLLAGELCKKLVLYCKDKDIKSGVKFKTKNGKPLDRSNIWKMMKNLCEKANVAKSKVFPHNLRHLFARTYYKLEKDISKLADILGHSDINTTRIYTIESGKTHHRQINKMRLIL